MYETLSRILVDDLHLNASEVHPDASCKDAGLDPLAMVELSLILLDELEVDISDDELMATKHVADIVRLMEERTRERQGRCIKRDPSHASPTPSLI